MITPLDSDSINRVRSASRVCFFAHYHQDDLLSPHVLHYLDAIAQSGFLIVVVSTSNLSHADESVLHGRDMMLLRRPNIGLDFGGWIDACTTFFPLEAELLMLANDSVYAPIGDFNGFLDDLIAQPADFYGAVESLEVAPHFQSWLLLFRPSAYRSRAFRNLMCTPFQASAEKTDIIQRYEVQVTRALIDAGLCGHSAMKLSERGVLARLRPYNPTHIVWSELIDEGIPFLKVDLLRTNPVRVTNIEDWRDVVAKKRPQLTAMIDDDLRRRPGRRSPSWLEMSAYHSGYWPELRWLIRGDYRRASRGRAMNGQFSRFLFFCSALPFVALRRSWRWWLTRRL